jgi:cellulose synthase/poly-beta-1,6-N-acetylglucosamine synthase-like glycosyltransferase
MDVKNQLFPPEKIQLILINDNSTDATLQRIQHYLEKEQGFIKFEVLVLNLSEDASSVAYKKRAISLGMQHATGELIITSDADCRRGPKWLSNLVAYYEKEQPEFISAPVAFQDEKNWFEKFQTLEFLGLIGIGAGSIGCGIPVMCNGANLAFKKKIFHEVNGYEGLDNIASGDDVFLMFKIAAKYPGGIHFVKSRDAIVYTNAKPNFTEFIEQRKRWASKGSKNSNTVVFLIGICTYMFNLLLLFAGVISIFYNTFTSLLIPALALKILCEFILLFLVTGFFRRRGLLFHFLQEQILYIPYIVCVGALGAFSKYTWKGRVLNYHRLNER